jgi:hypothetical protein
MAERAKDLQADLAPGDEPVRPAYERDFYSWLVEQARLLREAIARAYRKARIKAARETGLELATFAEACPYSFDDLTSRTFSR